MSSSNATLSRYNAHSSDFEHWLVVECRGFDEQFNPTHCRYARGTRYSPYPSPSDVWTRFVSCRPLVIDWLTRNNRCFRTHLGNERFDDLGLPDLIMAGKVAARNKLRRLDMDESLKAFLE